MAPLTSRLLQGLARLAAWRAGVALPLLAAVLALSLGLPSVTTGLSTDDLAHRNFIQSVLDGEADRPWWALFDVGGRAGPEERLTRILMGALPWWASPSLSISAFRPLSVASHFADYLLWPGSAPLMHLHNLVLLGLLAWLVTRLYARFFDGSAESDRAALALAALLFAVDDAHTEAAGWIASRNTLLTAIFVVAAWLAHDRLRRDAWQRGRWLTPLSLLLAFASSEGAIAFWGFAVPYALWLDRGATRERLAPLAWPLAVTLAWLGFYRAAGYGVRGSGLYVDPLGDPLYFLTLLPRRMLHYLHEGLVLPVALYGELPVAYHDTLTAAVVAFGVLVCIAIAMAWRARPRLRFWLAALFATLLPVCSAGPSPRLLLLPGIAAFGLLAELSVWALLSFAPQAGARGGGPRALVAALLFGSTLVLHLPFAAARAPFAARAPLTWDAFVRATTASFPSGDAARGKHVFVLNTPNHFATQLAPMYALERGGAPELVYIVGANVAPVTLSRPHEDTLVLTPEGGYLRELWSQMYRSPREPFRVGERMALGRILLTVDALTPDGRPASVRLTLRQADDPRLWWLTWDGRTRRYETVSLPAVGERVTLIGYVPGTPQLVPP